MPYFTWSRRAPLRAPATAERPVRAFTAGKR